MTPGPVLPQMPASAPGEVSLSGEPRGKAVLAVWAEPLPAVTAWSEVEGIE